MAFGFDIIFCGFLVVVAVSCVWGIETKAGIGKNKKNRKLVLLIIAVQVLVLLLLHRLLPFNFNNNSDKFIDGLLPPGFDEKSCLSRYQFNLYRKKPSPHKPSSPLLSKLRRYEALHRRCGPNSPSFRRALAALTSPTNSNSTPSPEDHCKYAVVLTRDGLGNRILTIASAFLYALISDRVLLIDRGNALDDLFCEPFLGSSWILPPHFPLRREFGSIRHEFSHILRNGDLPPLLPYFYLQLSHEATVFDNLFYCDRQQALISDFPWLIMETNNYLVPKIFTVPSFRAELHELFPAKDTVFHHLGRYLFHPRNAVWGLISRSYESYLARANEMVGIQIRVFGSEAGSFRDLMSQLLACAQKEKLLPEVESSSSLSTEKSKTNFSTNVKDRKLKVVLVTSLSSAYSEALKDVYWEHPTTDGEMLAVYQPSRERIQSSDKAAHNRKALAEMYLLSLSDALVTSYWSTFGYVAQGLGGVKAWMLYKAEEKVYWELHPWLKHRTRKNTSGDWPCRRALSMEPCFHAPPLSDCEGMNTREQDGGNVFPFVTHCEDQSWGIKLVHKTD